MFILVLVKFKLWYHVGLDCYRMNTDNTPKGLNKSLVFDSVYAFI